MKVTSMRIQRSQHLPVRAGNSPMTETSSVPVTSGATTWLGCMDFDLEGWVAPARPDPCPWLHYLVTLQCEPVLWVGREVAVLLSWFMLARDSLKEALSLHPHFEMARGYEGVRARDEECGPWAEGLLRGGGSPPSSQTAGSPKDEEKTCTLVEEAPHSMFRSVHCGFQEPCFY